MSAAPLPPPESPAAGGGGNDKVLAAVQHIVKFLATSKNAAEDIRILSGFDNRLSSITADLFPSPDLATSESSEIPSAAAFDPAEQLILLWDATPEALVFEAPEDDVAQYLAAVDVAIEHLACGSAATGGAEVYLVKYIVKNW